MERLKLVQAIFFDLDGTLLEIDMKTFIPAYVDGLATHFVDLVPLPLFRRTVLAATYALLRNDNGQLSNEALFLQILERHLNIAPALFQARFTSFCADNLDGLRRHSRSLPLVRQIVERCFERDLKVVIATNPVFPRRVIEARLDWAGLDALPYAHVTSYESCRFCKPHRAFFEDVMTEIGCSADSCLMVGNDTHHDLAAREAGMLTFLVDTWLVDRAEEPWESDFRGGHPDLFRFVQRLGEGAQE